MFVQPSQKSNQFDEKSSLTPDLLERHGQSHEDVVGRVAGVRGALDAAAGVGFEAVGLVDRLLHEVIGPVVAAGAVYRAGVSK